MCSRTVYSCLNPFSTSCYKHKYFIRSEQTTDSADETTETVDPGGEDDGNVMDSDDESEETGTATEDEETEEEYSEDGGEEGGGADPETWKNEKRHSGDGEVNQNKNILCEK